MVEHIVGFNQIDQNRVLGLGLGVGTVVLGCVLGVLAGVRGFSARYAEGLSYFSQDPAAAGCVVCHLPHDFIGKAENGYNHSKAFTLQGFPRTDCDQ